MKFQNIPLTVHRHTSMKIPQNRDSQLTVPTPGGTFLLIGTQMKTVALHSLST